MNRFNRLRGILLLLLLYCGNPLAGESPDEVLALVLADGTEVSANRFGSGGQRILWLPAERGTNPDTQFPLARGMADLGLEVWLLDLHDSYFLPPGRTSLDKVPQQDLAEMINLSLPEDKGQKLYLFSSGRGAALAARGLGAWQEEHGDDPRLGGMVFAYPNFESDVPEPGKDISYLPISFQTRAPIYLFQPQKSAKRWYLEGLVAAFKQGGSEVFTQFVADVGDGYLQRPERSEDELLQANLFPAELKQALAQLDTVRLAAAPKPGGQPPLDSAASQPAAGHSGLSASLQPYKGEPIEATLRLPDITGKVYDLQDYRGKVVLINFWATWCPPCVKEIPSLGRLQKQFPSEQFVVLSVDVGEPPAEVKAFLEKVPADYPVLLDEEGDIVKPWKLHAFPTTLVLDRDGTVKLAYFGGLEWDEPEVVDTLRRYMGL